MKRRDFLAAVIGSGGAIGGASGLPEVRQHNRALASACAAGLAKIDGVEVLWLADDTARRRSSRFGSRAGTTA